MSADGEVFFGDVELDDTLSAGPYRVEAEEIVEFARRYDPRPYHLDEEAGRQSIFGGLVASGILTIAIWNRLRFEAEAGLAQLAGLGVDKIRYHNPVRPGDVLRLEATCTAARPSASKPDRGILTYAHTILNQDGGTVMTLEVRLLVAESGTGR